MSREIHSAGQGERFVQVPRLSERESVEVAANQSAEKGLELSDAIIEETAHLCDGIPAALVWAIDRMSLRTPALVLQDLRDRSGIGDLTEYCFRSSFDSALRLGTAPPGRYFTFLAVSPNP